MNHYLAIDLGAESGRLILGTLENNQLSMREIHRFKNGMIHINNHYHWNIAALYSEILRGIEICVHEEKIIPESIGIDTWGVDYGLIAKDGTLMGLPFAYRDTRTENAINEFCKIVPKEKIYFKTGNLFAPYNTLFQLFAANKFHPELIKSARKLLFIPDLLAFFLTGKCKTEFSFATTSQLFNRKTNSWDDDLFKALGISKSLMQEVIFSGETIGTLNPTVMNNIQVPAIPVVAVATHDTASAIAAIPAKSSNWAFISSGTWSLMGIETESPVLTEESFTMNFTNEGGIGGQNYLLKNLMGLWILQQCRQAMKIEGNEYDYPTMMNMATIATPFFAFIDIDDSTFLNPENMNRAVVDFCKKTHQNIPENHAQIIRIVLESLALKYKFTLQELRKFKNIDELLITGGGINNTLLCQFTANACNLQVTTTLPEGTAAGNLMAQAMGAGVVKSKEVIRQVISDSFESTIYYPAETEKWEEAYSRYLKILN